ncbi:hypothetical protein B0O80DRAFT_435994 [Mortierella sp. GBAus27b]|nr:hypothetical protein B0O80DRAFT_435994 [Mortierella sp. GBAus27b]
MNVRAVQIWFQNRRQTLRKKSISLGTQQPGQGSEDDRCRSDEEFGHPLEEQCPSNLVTPVLSTDGRGGERERGLKRGSKSCSNLLSSTPQTVTDPNSTTLLRAETCSSLLTTVSVLPQQPRVTSTASSSPESGMANGTANEQTSGTGEVVVKTEVVESDPLRVSAAPATIPDIDTKTADRHLCMLLEEAKKRSGQCVAPVMGLWSEPSTKTVLNGSSSGNLSGTTTFPSSKRTMSTPTMRPSSSSQHSRSKARRHRSMPDPMTLQPSPVRLPYPRTVSLMERVINRQQHLRPASSNFKQSALSSTGKYSLDTISRRGTESSTTSTGLTPSQLARRLQYVMSANLKRVQSESVLHERRNTRRLGQTAMKARQLSFGTSLFESDPEDENRSTPPRLPSKGHEFEQLSHQAQKRRAGTSEPDHSSRTTDGDETDEEDFVALNERALKRLNLTKSIVSKSAADSRPQERGPQQQPPQPIKHRQDWSRLKLHQKSLKSSLSAFSLVTSSPTREYGLELDRSSSSLPNCPIIEKNRTWNSGSTMDQQSTITGTSSGHPKVSDPRSTDEKNLNMDELECASVLAGLGWGR